MLTIARMKHRRLQIRRLLPMGLALLALGGDAGAAATEGAEVAEVGTVAAEGAAAVVAPEVVLRP